MINVKAKAAAYVLQNFDIRPEVTEAMFDTGLLKEETVKRVLIRDEYQRRARTNKKTELKIHLAERWCVSLSTVEKIICEGQNLFP